MIMMGNIMIMVMANGFLLLLKVFLFGLDLSIHGSNGKSLQMADQDPMLSYVSCHEAAAQYESSGNVGFSDVSHDALCELL